MEDKFQQNIETSSHDLDAIEKRTVEIGRELFSELTGGHPGILQRRWWDDRIMAWAMKDETLKVQLFRFVDVLPMLDTTEQVVGHLLEYLSHVRDRLPATARLALGVARRTPMTRAALARAARLGAMDFARRFIAGTNVREVLDAAMRERKLNRAFTLDILGEAVTSEAEAEQYFNKYVNLIETVAPKVNAWPEIPQIDRGVLGKLPRMNLSIKLSALDSRFDAIDPRGVLDRVGERFRQLLRVARQHDAFINVDMESYDKKDLTLEIFKSVLLEDEFRDYGDVGIVIQCYLRDAGRDLVSLRDWAVARAKPVWVRLVKGAYWDYETAHAQAHGWPIPVYQQKWQSDKCFEEQSRFLLANYQNLRPAFGSHNIRSLAHAIAAAEHLQLPDGGFELQMLYGMADAEKQELVERGHRLRIYMPYGELIPGMAYLVRRLLENTSNDSFLRAGFMKDAPVDQLLQMPGSLAQPAGESAEGELEQEHDGVTAMSSKETSKSYAATFENEPHFDFARAENREAMQLALADVSKRLGTDYPLVIGGVEHESGEWIESFDPSRKTRLVGRAAKATGEHATDAVALAKQALPQWWKLGVEARADFLRQAADAMEERLFELSAWEVFECAKPWREATADVCEAIDFCRFYADRGVELQGTSGADVPGEQNRFEYIPRGVTAVIAPWNFPLAILTGMTVASLVTGNTVVMKPAEQSPVVAAQLMRIFKEIGLPPGVCNYLPGYGETGAALVDHPDVVLICFTGSREVGLAINAKAAELSTSGTAQVKRVIAEMGGKNAIIVDDDADLDEAVMGVVHSAFGYQGQKCSACSRAIVLSSVYDQFLTRLVEAARSLKIGPAEDPATDVGPVIDGEAFERVNRYIDIARKEGREMLAGDVGPLAEQGYFIAPHIFADVSPDARIAQEEIFGPVLAVMRADSFDQALQIANGTDYGLTGGVFSRSPARLEQARREFLVGNLYLNQRITGSLVGRQPFGGFKMSGIGGKAGGHDYLLQFVVPRTITENTMRRGFAPPTNGD